jgi:hypothetical protein
MQFAVKDLSIYVKNMSESLMQISVNNTFITTLSITPGLYLAPLV